ncbi:MAG: LysR family transcriptional regulator [Pseudonocardia sp.]|uniref:LysR family transcriptional regulator n=1 Tax=unclassified Pseudonocardia TaxID=2619320 RepID=UPI00086A7222|nr:MULTISPECIES: LysR family transcriptional regulator [unclassified Pseudonocardia]MBN9112405.1 LysR family transcriptional regulator [Pseudonocardia sp.]ODU27322.1 MAG: LysR family transcriptional regulator [Pseudonocardia sp. SCN 72-51]ODV08935.1 MAG: LysR family transcriptional regulator [Pseudonocardia sp. SCN 73-27]
MTLLQLKVLIAVAERGGFTAAGAALGMSQPAVSRSVAALEAELGAPLLTRNRDGVTLTEAGVRAVTHAREAVRQSDLLRAEVAAVSGQVTGTLRLASLPSATGTLVAPRLRPFAERYPLVKVRLLEGSDGEVRDWLDQGVVDAAVVTMPAPGLRLELLDSHEMVAVLPAGHPLGARDTVDYEALAAEPFIRSNCGCAQVFESVARQVGVRLDVAFEARELSAVLEMVGAGLGVSIVPAVALRAVPVETIVRPLVPRTVRTLAVAVSASASPAARAFLDEIARNRTGPAVPVG